MSNDVQASELIQVFADNLRRRRMELGLSQSALVTKLNDLRQDAWERLPKKSRGDKLHRVFVPYISDLERAVRAPHVETLAELAEVLETTPGALLACPEKVPA